MYTEDEYLMLSGIQHFVFCKRQWALIHVEQQWEENFRTMDGQIMHRNAHEGLLHERRGNTIVVRALPIASAELGLSGECDVVEFCRDKTGIELQGLQGKYVVIPVEYKRGEPKDSDCDIVQLTAQAMCLEEMLCCEILRGYIFYGENRRRFLVEFDDSLRERTRALIQEMHSMFERRHTPKVKRSKACNACSLKNICLPAICGTKVASAYMKKVLEEDAR